MKHIEPLCFGEIAPISYQVGFLKAPWEDCASSLEQGYRKLKYGVEVVRLEGSVPEAAGRLDPLNPFLDNFLLVPFGEHGTAMYTNGYPGGDFHSDVLRLSSALACKGIFVVSRPTIKINGTIRHFGGIVFDAHAPGPDGHMARRYLYLGQESARSWKFHAEGEPRPCERHLYPDQDPKQWFTSTEALARLLECEGLRATDEQAYGPDAMLIRLIGRAETTRRTLREVQEALGLLPASALAK